MRIRTIKPDFWTSLPVSELTWGARLTFIGMWNIADDEGRGIADPRAIRAKIWALDDGVMSAQVAEWLDEIENRDLITKYSPDGRALFQVKSWSEHQKIDKPTKSSYPPPGGLPEPSPSASGALDRKEGRNKEGRKEGVIIETEANF